MIDLIISNTLKPLIKFGYSIYGRFIYYSLQEVIGKSQLKRIGKAGANCIIHGSITIHNPERLELGDHVRIGTNCFLFCLGGLKIGRNTQLSRNITIYTANHNIEGNAIPYDNTYINKSVEIGESVWIGMNVCVIPGVKIGDGAIIGMGTVVSKNVLPGEIVVGSEQRVIKKRNMDTFYHMKNEELFFGKKWPNL
ncbi:MAG: acyltransferase [Breznakibacter sp.]